MAELLPHSNHEDSLACWCRPCIQVECSQCDGLSGPCWKCGGSGWVRVDRLGGKATTHLITHHAPGEACETCGYTTPTPPEPRDADA